MEQISDNNIQISKYIEFNELYLQKEKQLNNKIEEDIKNNPQDYPVNAEELYNFDYMEDITDENEEALVVLENVILEKFKDDYEELDNLRENIIKYAGHIVDNEEVVQGEN